VSRRLKLSLLQETCAICRLAPGSPIPSWVQSGDYWSITRTPEELSVVVPEAQVPQGVMASRGWRALRFAGPLPLDQTGILSSVTSPLAAAHISVFVIATFDTDYVLIPEAQQRDAFVALERAGHSVISL
jgi:hypothetical protein